MLVNLHSLDIFLGKHESDTIASFIIETLFFKDRSWTNTMPLACFKTIIWVTDCWQQSFRDASVTTASLKDFIVSEADWGRWKCPGVVLSFCPLSDLYYRKHALRSSCLSSEECVLLNHRLSVSSVVLLFVTRDIVLETTLVVCDCHSHSFLHMVWCKDSCHNWNQSEWQQVKAFNISRH